MDLPQREQVMKALHQVDQDSITGEDSDPDPIDALVAAYGWEATRDAIVAILRDKNYAEWWEVAINALNPGISDRKPMEDNDYFIALMYACWKQFPGPHDEAYLNTIWTLVIILKKIGY